MCLFVYTTKCAISKDILLFVIYIAAYVMSFEGVAQLLLLLLFYIMYT